MKFHTHNDTPSINTNMTSLQGYVQATRAELTKVFGEPIYDPHGSKVFYRWEIQFINGAVATIYDWRSQFAPSEQSVHDWHIGGHVRAAVEAVHDTFREASDLKARAA